MSESGSQRTATLQTACGALRAALASPPVRPRGPCEHPGSLQFGRQPIGLFVAALKGRVDLGGSVARMQRERLRPLQPPVRADWPHRSVPFQFRTDGGRGLKQFFTLPRKLALVSLELRAEGRGFHRPMPHPARPRRRFAGGFRRVPR